MPRKKKGAARRDLPARREGPRRSVKASPAPLGDAGVPSPPHKTIFETAYTEHLKGRRVLLETPTGFAVFVVYDFAFEQDKNIWVHFADPECAIQALFALGFKKVDKSAARSGDAGPREDLLQLIRKFCRAGETWIVQDKELKDLIEKKIGITCRCDGYDVGEVIWGIKNVLHEFIREEEDKITHDYCLPLSKGLQEALQYYVVNIPPGMVDKTFIKKFGFLCYLDMNLEGFPKELVRSFDKYVGIGDTIKDGLDYAKVLAMVLFPELVKRRDFSKTFSSDLKSKLQQAKLFQANRNDDLTVNDLEKIMGYLEYLSHVPHLRDKIIMEVKLMEAAIHKSPHAVEKVNVWGPIDYNKMKFRRVLLKTPSGFAIFNVSEVVFCNPEDTWSYFTDIDDARYLVFAIGFTSVDEKSVTRNIDDGLGDELRQLILRFCNAKRELIVQDTQLKAVIESELDVKCCTGNQVVEDVIWGLKYVLHHFILKERDKITDNYVHPPSKKLLRYLERYGISTKEITADIIDVIGYVNALDKILKKTSEALRAKCDCYVSDIIFGEDDVPNASMIAKVAKVLVPEFKEEIELPEIAVDLPKDAGKVIANHDKQEIMKYLKTLSDVCKERNYALQRLLEIDAQIGVGRMAVGNEAVGKDGKDDDRKGSNKDGESGKKCETEVTNKGKTETMGSSKDDRFANNCERNPMENGRSANKGKRVDKVKTKPTNNSERNPMENGRSANKGKRGDKVKTKPTNNCETKPMENGRSANNGK